MAHTIEIFNPKDRPFGELSNNSRHPMRIPTSDKLNAATMQYPTVTNYIYSKIMRTPAYSAILAQYRPTKDVQTEFNKLIEQQNSDLVRRSVLTALEAKFQQNEDLRGFLLATGTAPINYVSNNPNLGTGSSNNGMNMYGKALMEVRNRLRNVHNEKSEEQAKVEQEQLIYDTYLAHKALTELLRNGEDSIHQTAWDQVADLTKQPPGQIVDIMGREKLQKKSPSQDAILNLAYRGSLEEVMRLSKRPENLVLQVLKNEMGRLQLVRKRKRKELVFDMYADYLLRKHYPSLSEDQYAKAKTQQFIDLPIQQRHDLENRLFELFNKGMLSSSLSDKIDEELELVRVPTEEEVKAAEDVKLDYTDQVAAPKVGWQPESGEPILVYPVMPGDTSIDPQYLPYAAFSPVAIELVRIDGRCFPTIAHYITFALMGQLQDALGSIDAAYQQLLVKPGETTVKGVDDFATIAVVTHRYRNYETINFSDMVKKAAKTGLDYKFKDYRLQKLLVDTGNAELIWNDFSNPFLGVNKGKRTSNDNFVGRYLMTLREQFRESHQAILIDKVTTADISGVIRQDSFMQWWINMRVGDMCKAIGTLKHHLWSRDGHDQEINPVFATAVLDEVYQPCSHLFGKVDLVSAEATEEFTDTVRNAPGFASVSHEVIDVLWKRVVVMIYYLVEHMKDTTVQSLKAALGQIQALLSVSHACNPAVLSDDTDNCIVSAIGNLLVGIKELTKKFSGYEAIIQDTDVHTAVAIILNTDVSDQLSLVPMPKGSGDDFYDEDDSDGEKTPEFEFPDDETDTDDEGQYGDSMFEDSGNEEDSPPPSDRIDMIRHTILTHFPDLVDSTMIAHVVDAAIDTIKTSPVPSTNIKQNRINFFATLR